MSELLRRVLPAFGTQSTSPSSDRVKPGEPVNLQELVQAARDADLKLSDLNDHVGVDTVESLAQRLDLLRVCLDKHSAAAAALASAVPALTGDERSQCEAALELSMSRVTHLTAAQSATILKQQHLCGAAAGSGAGGAGLLHRRGGSQRTFSYLPPGVLIALAKDATTDSASAAAQLKHTPQASAARPLPLLPSVPRLTPAHAYSDTSRSLAAATPSAEHASSASAGGGSTHGWLASAWAEELRMAVESLKGAGSAGVTAAGTQPHIRTQTARPLPPAAPAASPVAVASAKPGQPSQPAQAASAASPASASTASAGGAAARVLPPSPAPSAPSTGSTPAAHAAGAARLSTKSPTEDNTASPLRASPLRASPAGAGAAGEQKAPTAAATSSPLASPHVRAASGFTPSTAAEAEAAAAALAPPADEKEAKRLRLRGKALQELLSTEATYLSHLHRLANLFVLPLRGEAPQAGCVSVLPPSLAGNASGQGPQPSPATARQSLHLSIPTPHPLLLQSKPGSGSNSASKAAGAGASASAEASSSGATFLSLEAVGRLLSPFEHERIFNSVDGLIPLHITLLQEIAAALKLGGLVALPPSANAHPADRCQGGGISSGPSSPPRAPASPQKSPPRGSVNPDAVCIGTLFVRLSPFLKMYARYTGGHSNADAEVRARLLHIASEAHLDGSNGGLGLAGGLAGAGGAHADDAGESDETDRDARFAAQIWEVTGEAAAAQAAAAEGSAAAGAGSSARALAPKASVRFLGGASSAAADKKAPKVQPVPGVTFSRFVRIMERDPNAGRQNLYSLLAMPVQRVPRYALLLKGESSPVSIAGRFRCAVVSPHCFTCMPLPSHAVDASSLLTSPCPVQRF
jgi:hypothetical protein